jgi:hypothetical protein
VEARYLQALEAALELQHPSRCAVALVDRGGSMVCSPRAMAARMDAASIALSGSRTDEG